MDLKNCLHNENSADLNHRDYTTLCEAVKSRNRDVVLQLVKSRCPKLSNTDEFSHLHVACMMNKVNVVEKLVSSSFGKNINEAVDKNSLQWPGFTALHFAVHYGCIDTVEYLLKCDVDITAKDARELTPLHLADLQRNEKIIDLLLAAHKHQYKNPVSCQGLSHFHIACTRDDESIVEHFLKLGVDINLTVDCPDIMPWSKWRPIDFAVYYRCLNVFKFLLKAGTTLDSLHFPVLLKHAFTEDRSFYNSIINEKSQYVESTEKFEPLLFHLACIQNNTKIMEEILLEHNACIDINTSCHNGSSPLHLAAAYNCSEAVILLLHLGANILAQDSQNRTPIHVAFRHRNFRMLQLLIENLTNFSKNSIDDEELSIFHMSCTTDELQAGFTALHFACAFQQRETVLLLLKHGAGISITNKFSLNPLDLMTNYLSLASLLSCDHHQIFEFLTEMIGYLYAKGSPIKGKAISTLHALCFNKTTDLRMIKDYLSSTHQVEINQTINLSKFCEYNKCTPLHLAIFSHNPDLAMLLLKHEANPLMTHDEEKTPLEYIFRYVYRSSYWNQSKNLWIQVSESCLLTQNTSIDKNPGQFHMACAIGLINVVRCELDTRSNMESKKNLVNSLNDYYELRTPLHHAYSHVTHLEDIDDIGLLLSHGANVNAKDLYGETTLVATHSAHLRDNKDLLNLLLDNGADINAVDKKGQTYLMTLVEGMIRPFVEGYPGQSEECIEICLKHIEKLKLIGLDVSEPNLAAATEWLEYQCETFWVEGLEDHRFVVSHHIQICQEELESMGAVNIDRYTTLRSVLSNSLNEMANYCMNTDLQRLIEGEQFSKTYPNYGYLVKLQMKYGKIRRSLLTKSRIPLMSLISVELPEPCSNSILHYLSNEDLVKIIKIGEKSKEHM
ncbi:hypothetical protein QAD02_010106 [Eretmocerus hayati]|uniref:Uncharacterized protein n=1 Tax=Eretmocerus hayati TaxID=131215 RepID=A0ACC2NBW1_9HYME|nr:hypothetical protein QAD02_010106 [Eretmocerus hayati]